MEAILTITEDPNGDRDEDVSLLQPTNLEIEENMDELDQVMIHDHEVEVGDLTIIKTEQDNDDKLVQFESEVKVESPKNSPEISSSEYAAISSKQLKAMKKYSTEIGKDLKTKIISLKNGTFVCRICNFSKSALESMRGHLALHRDGNPFRCPVPTCDRLCHTHALLTQHIKIHLPTARKYRCTLCPAKFKGKSHLKSHILTHSTTKPYACTVQNCRKRFAQKAMLNKHGETHLNLDEREQWVCSECGMQFLSKVGFQHHSNRHKGIEKMRNYSCYFCEKKMQTPSARNFHLQTHTLERPFPCGNGQCKMWLTSLAGLRSHEHTHVKTDPFCCPHCPKEFKWKNDLATHIKRKHDENAPVYQCIHCSYTTVWLKDLERHGRRIHLKLRPHKCPLCPMTFAEKSGRDLHVKTHSTNRPFKCKVCSKGFITQARLNYHMQIHSENKLPCPKCDSVYKTKLGRDIHLKQKHGIGQKTTDVTCYFCTKLYHGYSGLLKHLRTHTREKPYQCPEPECSKTWLTSGENLTYHLLSKHGKGKPRVIRSDTDERFQCAKCSRSYKYKGDLQKHEKIAHDETAPLHKCTEPGCKYVTREKKCLSGHVKAVHLKVTYKCRNCSKRYKKKSDLTKHSRDCQ